jgi:hypothetical protein
MYSTYKYVNIDTCMGDYTLDWIYCTLYIHNSGLQAIQRYR